MIAITADTRDFGHLGQLLASLAPDKVPVATARALTRVAVGARADVKARMPEIFDRPTAFTVNAVRYQMARANDLTARVYLSEDAPKGISPRNYLGPEIDGGPRRDKRSERALKSAGLMQAGQQWTPGKAMPLDSYGNVPGPVMVQMLSRLSAFGEQGFRANASAATRRKLAKQGKATARTGTDIFVARSKRGGEPIGVYQLMSKGVVKMMLAFVDKRPTYKPRFDFPGLVKRYVDQHLNDELAKSFAQSLERLK